MIDVSGHKHVFDPDRIQSPIHIIGCGGMGSRVAEGLVRMGLGRPSSPVHLYDHDVFEPKNRANQWIGSTKQHERKVDATAENMMEIYPDCRVSAHAMRVENYLEMGGVVFVCVDSMKARKVIMEKVLEQNAGIECVIETRMDAQTGISHCFRPSSKAHQECWWLYWHSDDEAKNIAGCNGVQSIISAIYGTTMLALRQFEEYARRGHAFSMANRVYMDFNDFHTRSEVWPGMLA